MQNAQKIYWFFSMLSISFYTFSFFTDKLNRWNISSVNNIKSIQKIPNLLSFLDIISFAINIIFLLQTILLTVSYPASLLKIWHLANIFFFLCSFGSFYLHVIMEKIEFSNDMIDSDDIVDSLLNSAQILRFFLIMKHVKFIKIFMRRFQTIITKSFTIITLFFIIIFFYGLIGKVLVGFCKFY